MSQRSHGDPINSRLCNRGHVYLRDASGSPVSRAEVLILDEDGRAYFDDRFPNGYGDNTLPSPFTTGGGLLGLEHVRPGQYRVSARKGTAVSSETKVTVVEGKRITVELTLDEPWCQPCPR